MSSSGADAAPAPVATNDKDATADELAAPPEAVQMTDEEEMGAAADKDQSDSGKLKTLMGILKRMVGVKDIAAIRISLPANLLEPVPNLEYWNYLDRGDFFTLVPDLDDPLDRMLAVLRFTFTKELKYVKGKICKPYNSILGEHFRCHWDFEPAKVTDSHILPVQSLAVEAPEPLPLASNQARTPTFNAKKGSAPPSPLVTPQDQSRPSSVRNLSMETSNNSSSNNNNNNNSTSSAKKGLSKLLGRKKSTKDASEAANAAASSAHAAGASEDATDNANDAASVSGSSTQRAGKRRLCFLTEQVSHHPPISSFFCEAKDAGVQLYGVDQLGAKFTGTSVKVFPGEQNQGIFLRLTENAKCGAAGEEYQITHPTASINGLLRGSLWVAICDNLYVTCRGGKRDKGEGDDGSRLRAIVEYKDESWITKAKYALEGVIYSYGPNDDPEEYTSAKQVPQDKVLATFEGCWKGKITYKRKGDKESRVLLNITDVDPISKSVRPLAAQEEMESRRIWEPVTNAILGKKYSEATKNKQDIEQMQRNAAAERKRNGETFVPRFFDADISDGRPKLTDEGRKAIDGEYQLAGYDGAADDKVATVNAGKAEDADEDDEDDFQDAQN